MILFLDYDGVLHPDPCSDKSRLFENAYRLVRTLDPFPEVSIVLSTSWRNVRPDDALLGPLPERLRNRVIGRTPKFSDCAATAGRVPYRRHVECEQWLRNHHMSDSPWWALDDRADWFSPYCENLLECDSLVGFDERMARLLSCTLEVARRRAARSPDLVLA